MPKYSIFVNGKTKTVEVENGTPLLWVLRDNLNLIGTKFGCGIGICGSCTVLIDGKAEKSCSVSIESVEGKSITTIEGLAENRNNPLLKAWIEVEVSQCGYCQPGQILAAAALLNENPNPSDKEIEEAMNEVLCRCGTYNRIKKAIKKVVAEK
ncbi:Isoquinoline 1-oxidoreductase subunit alpha [Melioribacter roseus P3M-2]|uniref:Isoquinoline 1-oxidoreductase subunit alpha n=1 Tax=Melioribacter roseus (strain DSM 23840 / JCM 17771 / VKM B-2668 / P3M-2) TaxID=1191523 RepID=I6YUQ3_MELRP|nr:(2Fe-2S)-binding protein [Melioribacter roseus]AFN74297.1 Isoquinoline 1-oxidoreductase subunit alpha [Melioribacter roseus P3M-2]